jgi:aminoglycoside phosphotransferase (APT) family kinase protein
MLTPARKMHADEVDIDVSLVRRLLAAQFPHWADLPIEPLSSTGTVNAIYRLGHDMAVRLPRVRRWAGDLQREQHWLPKLAPHLPLAVPEPLAKGSPGEGYPWHWSVYRWLDGENATIDRIADPRQAAIELARFIAALRRIDPTGAPPGRGVSLAMRDADTRAAIASLGSIVDADALTAAWDAALHATAWDDPPVWIHGDLLYGNLLAVQGRLSAVIDWGCVGVGDPACDAMVAWTFFSAETRDVFRAALSVDDASWARGRGWALSVALIFVPYYLNTNPVGVGAARRTIDEVLADHRSSRP